MINSIREKIFFKNKKGLKLCGILSDPTDDKSKPIVVFCHGHSTNKDSVSIQKIAEMLNAENISTFRFDVSGHGESGGKFEEITVSDAMDDILSAVDYVKSLGYGKIGLYGASFGGAASILAAERLSELFVLALKAAVSDYRKLETEYRGAKLKEWKEKGWAEYQIGDPRNLRLNYSFFSDFDNFNEYESAKNIKTPTIIVHGSADKDVPADQSKKLATMISGSKLEIIEGADHKFSEPEHFQKMLELISGFIIKNAK